MAPQRGSVRAVFDRALEIESPIERRAYLDEACAGNPAWRQEVESLLRAHGQAGDFLDRPAVEQVSATPPLPPDATAALEGAAVAGKSADARQDRPGPTETQAEPGGEEEETALDFLQPSTKSGSLGRLAHYEVQEVLGKGGFGIVLKAFDEKLHRVVAVKVMAPHLAATSPARKRFLREARASAAIRHENVVAIYAVDDQPIPYLVMEYIAGKTLQDRLDGDGPLDLKEVLRIGRQVADGLAAAHAMGIIHRDIKPANILLESGVDHVKITDFGLARAADDASVTQSGVVAGTPMYMAPEQARGEPLDHRADLFSLGSVLYQMCTGRPPFRAATTFAVLKRVAEDTPRPMREIIPEVPEWLCAIVARLHAKKPEDRYASAKEVADLLARHLLELQLRGNVSSPPPGPATPQRSEPTREGLVPSPIAPRARRSGRRWMAAAAVFLLLLTGLGVTEVSGVTHLAGAAFRLFHPNREVPPVPEEPPPPAVAPFDAQQARAHQEAWAKHLHVPVEVENSIGMKLRLVPPGTFLMGSPDDEQGREPTTEGPQHEVVLTRPFYMGVHDVTVGQFKVFVKEHDYRTDAETNGGAYRFSPETDWKFDPQANWRNPGFEQNDDQPVVCVSWNDAKAFCDWLSDKEGKQYALATEAQWEFSCRAGSGTKFYFGDDDGSMPRYAWYNKNSDWKTHAVGQKKPNDWGLYDMHGNVWEWCADRYAADYYQEAPKTNPPGASAGKTFVLRGGAWNSDWWKSRAASRLDSSPSNCTTHVGFRVAVVDDLSKFNPDRPTGTGSRKVPGGPPPLAVAPFDAKQAGQHQEAWAKHLGGPVQINNSIGIKLALIPPGQFLMGSPDGEASREADEGPQHEVVITMPFYMGVHDVTVGQFKAFVKEKDYQTEAEQRDGAWRIFPNGEWKNDPNANWQNPGFEQTDDHPVVCVSWNDARAFCEWLSAKEGKHYALSTEAQWEYGCRAGSQTKFYFGDDDAPMPYAWYNENSKLKTHPVGQKKPNSWGLYDMHGNVWQWTADWYAADYYKKCPKEDPPGPSAGDARVLRGGAWSDGWPTCRDASRLGGDHPPSHCSTNIGFRVVLLP